ncbi:hypothetical protein SLEP1_g4957 [Rubroshorea leprosula]|uniref:Uncharacterized protein n=1 Tax=Rubroshorea leprosula TaxID=152421 RepID=A0AAV5HQF2_9ROSI|nr:hypothetical protein SLEP1_g4957 [Rubroshorea leprosula]
MLGPNFWAFFCRELSLHCRRPPPTCSPVFAGKILVLDHWLP